MSNLFDTARAAAASRCRVDGTNPSDYLRRKLRSPLASPTGMRLPLLMATLVALLSGVAWAQNRLPVRWENLSAPDFVRAIQKAQGTCILPFGIMEKHGPQLPLGTDLFDIRYIAVHAAEQDYSVVFPPYYFGNMSEVREQPGEVTYSPDIQMRLLEETTDEMARNGCKKIVIANGHGGNNNLVDYFTETQLTAFHDYVVYAWNLTAGWWNIVSKLPGQPRLKYPNDRHAGEWETSWMLVARPDLVHLGQLKVFPEQWQPLHRLHLSPPLFTAMSWYANYPNQIAGDAAAANKTLGEFDMKALIRIFVDAIRSVKADNESLKLQNAFYKHAAHPLETPQTGTWWIK